MDSNGIKKCIASMTLAEIENDITHYGLPKFRAKQIYEWIHKKHIIEFDEMSNISKELRQKLRENYCTPQIKIERKYEALEDSTVKYLFRLGKATIIESVLMKYSFGNSICISSQAGCKMGCSFCYSAKNGLERNLSAYEMLAQVYLVQKDIGQRISNIVLMGSGEPLDNYDNVLNFIKIITSKDGVNIGARHITLSTCGIVPAIYKLAEEGFPLNLALSLHGSNDACRKEIMPIAMAFSMEEIFKACDFYSEKTGRRVTYEYALIKDINDSPSNAQELAKKLRGRLCHVNIIPINETGSDYKKPSKEAIALFAKCLKERGIEATIRRELGSSINAACGQLKGGFVESQENKKK